MKEEGRRKKEEGRGKNEEGRSKEKFRMPKSSRSNRLKLSLLHSYFFKLGNFFLSSLLVG
jgi:hypothetical protein